MLESICDPGIITSAQIVRDLELRGFNMHGVPRQAFLRRAGVPIISVYPYGRGGVCFVKEEDWIAARDLIIGQDNEGMPIVREKKKDAKQFTQPTKITKKEVQAMQIERLSVMEKKIDLMNWAVLELLKMEAKYGT